MDIYYSPKFVKQYRRLPSRIKILAEQKEQIFRLKWSDERLKSHKLLGRFDGLWAFSVNYSYRILFEFEGNECVLFHGVGTHEIYED